MALCMLTRMIMLSSRGNRQLHFCENRIVEKVQNNWDYAVSFSYLGSYSNWNSPSKAKDLEITTFIRWRLQAQTGEMKHVAICTERDQAWGSPLSVWGWIECKDCMHWFVHTVIQTPESCWQLIVWIILWRMSEICVQRVKMTRCSNQKWKSS